MEKDELERILHSENCDDLLRQEGIFIRYKDMPAGISAVTIYDDENCYYNVYLNSKMTNERNMVSVHHEIIEHIGNDDWHSNLQIEKIEFNARKGAGQF